MLLNEAIEQGYKLGDCQYQRGYLPRRGDYTNPEVHTAGGARKGEKYILLPCYHSRQYVMRQYLYGGAK